MSERWAVQFPFRPLLGDKGTGTGLRSLLSGQRGKAWVRLGRVIGRVFESIACKGGAKANAFLATAASAFLKTHSRAHGPPRCGCLQLCPTLRSLTQVKRTAALRRYAQLTLQLRERQCVSRRTHRLKQRDDVAFGHSDTKRDEKPCTKMFHSDRALLATLPVAEEVYYSQPARQRVHRHTVTCR